MYKLCFYVPLKSASAVKAAVFAAGAGKIGPYSHYCFETEGAAQFLPLKGAQPVVGSRDRLERVREVKVETVCEPGKVLQVIDALLDSHPYEMPAYQVWPVLSRADFEGESP